MRRRRSRKPVVKRKKDGSKLYESDVAELLRGKFDTHKMGVSNIYLFPWESDYLSITNSGLLWEFEIKLSKADFRADFKKKKRHSSITKKYRGFKPNRFYWVFPEGMVEHEEVPTDHGIIEIRKYQDPKGKPYYGLNKIRTAQVLHSKPFNRWETLAKKLWYKNMRLLGKLAEKT